MADRKTFENAKNSWLQELMETAEDDGTLRQCVSLVGNKTDMQAVVSEPEHSAAVSSLNLNLSSRTSAKTGDSVIEAFNALVIAVYDADKGKSGAKKGPASGGGVVKPGSGPAAKKAGSGCC